MPLCYNGRASSVVVSGTAIHRPWGLVRMSNGAVVFHQSKRFDYETELGFFVSTPIPRGEFVPAKKARDHIFGFVVLNDWSARDIQFLEMTPLGPFNGKSSNTSISPWVVTMEALEEVGALLTNEQPAVDDKNPSIVPFLRCNESLSIRVSTYISRESDKTLGIHGFIFLIKYRVNVTHPSLQVTTRGSISLR